MVVKIHHLNSAQSERIIWLCEELKIPYHLQIHRRDPFTAPQSLKDISPLGTAPFIEDGDIRFGESAAIVEYLIAKYSDSSLRVSSDAPNYPNYLFWFHFPGSSLLPAIVTVMQFWLGGMSKEGTLYKSANSRMETCLQYMNSHLENHTYLAGDTFSAADIMAVYPLTTIRYMFPLDLTPYPYIVRYLQTQIGTREAYRAAHEKGDPDAPYALEAKPPESTFAQMTRSGWAGAVLMPMRMVVRLLGGLFRTGDERSKKSN
jgi:glutathione S-transferase